MMASNADRNISDIFDSTQDNSLILLDIRSCTRLRCLSDGRRGPWLVLIIDDLRCCGSHYSLPLGATVVCRSERLADSARRILVVCRSRSDRPSLNARRGCWLTGFRGRILMACCICSRGFQGVDCTCLWYADFPGSVLVTNRVNVDSHQRRVLDILLSALDTAKAW